MVIIAKAAEGARRVAATVLRYLQPLFMK